MSAAIKTGTLKRSEVKQQYENYQGLLTKIRHYFITMSSIILNKEHPVDWDISLYYPIFMGAFEKEFTQEQATHH